MFGEPVAGGSEDAARRWKPEGYLAWLKAKTLIRGRYELLGYLGSGSIGSVFLARHIGFDETVALKFLQPRYLASPDTAEHFVREARAGFKLRSEHIARVYDVDVHEHVPFIAMEMLEGETLRALLKRRGALGRATSVDYALQACAALASAHALGHLHLDIKPENMFVLGDEHIKLVDFGISQIASADSSGAALHYVAPERLRAGASVGAQSDIWSLACVLYELLSGRATFSRGGLFATCAAVLEDEPVALTTLPDGLWSVLARCLQKQSEERFADVAELATALEPFGSGRYNHYAERCRVQLNPETAPTASPPPSAAEVSKQPTLVLGQTDAAEPPQAAQKPTSRTATLAFDVSAFASPAEAMRELDATNLPESTPAATESTPPATENIPAATESTPAAVYQALPKPNHRPSPGRLLLLMAALLSMAWACLALFTKPERHSESPKLMHIVTPQQK